MSTVIVGPLLLNEHAEWVWAWSTSFDTLNFGSLITNLKKPQIPNASPTRGENVCRLITLPFPFCTGLLPATLVIFKRRLINAETCTCVQL